ncbi:uncharacterized protein [Palaemon carinicauda]|uniref:uncharacterized protein n=1 Tax=Palaemon carinicauda TaxID=392227 RepID=UPI0035B620F6
MVHQSSAPRNDSPEDFAQQDGSAEGSAYPVSPTCGQNPQGRLHQLQEDIALQRSRASAGQLAQAERMVKRSRLERVPGDPGDNVTIPIPLVDRGKGDPQNVIGVILDRNENDMYRIGVRDGILKGHYSRSQFDICSHQLYSIDEISADKEIGLHQAVQQSSRFGGQGYAKCNCTAGKKQCQTNRCKCYKEGHKCDSRGHSSLNLSPPISFTWKKVQKFGVHTTVPPSPKPDGSVNH